MSSTYSTSLRLQLMGTGDQSGTWGTTTNTNLGTLLEQAVTGYQAISIGALTSYTLTNLNGVTDQARNAVLSFTGTLTSVCAITAPAVAKMYVVNNATAGGFGITFNTSASGSSVTIPNGATYIIYSDATNFYFASNYYSANVNITGGTIGGTTTYNNTGGLYTFGGTGALTLPSGTTDQEPGTPVAGMFRFNTSTNVFEGYNGTAWGPIGGGNSTANGFWQNTQTITSNQAITSGYSATSAGPITVASGVSVTIPSGSRWVIL